MAESGPKIVIPDSVSSFVLSQELLPCGASLVRKVHFLRSAAPICVLTQVYLSS